MLAGVDVVEQLQRSPGRAWTGSLRGRVRRARPPRRRSRRRSPRRPGRYGQVGPDPLDRVAQLPGLQLAGQPVPRRVVGRGVRAHPVGEGLDQRRALALAGRSQRLLRDRVAGEDVVAVHPDAGEPEAAGPLVQRDAGLLVVALGDGPLVVLAEEHDRRVEHRCPDERLVHVTLAGRAIAEVGDDRLVGSVALHPHRVAGRVQGLRADHDRVEVEIVLLRVPPAEADATVKLEEPLWVEAAAPGDAVLPVGGERHVGRLKRASRADLGGLLAKQRGPDAELSLALQGDGLGVHAAHQDHVPVHPREVDLVVFERIVRMFQALAFGREQLDEFGILAGRVLNRCGECARCVCDRTARVDGHVPLLSSHRRDLRCWPRSGTGHELFASWAIGCRGRGLSPDDICRCRSVNMGHSHLPTAAGCPVAVPVGSTSVAPGSAFLRDRARRSRVLPSLRTCLTKAWLILGDGAPTSLVWPQVTSQDGGN